MVHGAPATFDAHVEILKAIADPVRLDLLRRVAAVPEMACTDLVEATNVAKSTVSYHMKMLRMAGLIEVRKVGRNFFYTYQPDSIQAVAAVLDDLGH
ncbi:ArsR/SmtB family transcription factor [Rhodococcoides fascians]|uniref:ArsR/SmtB family transcription factor n=1 Tax=Rhodococcoides fascians TaxID=1828 RepID=UPI00050C4B38|nr:metalloregulator ArsR/SmtB family transcription factor [Rhodococcus fascians]